MDNTHLFVVGLKSQALLLPCDSCQCVCTIQEVRPLLTSGLWSQMPTSWARPGAHGLKTLPNLSIMVEVYPLWALVSAKQMQCTANAFSRLDLNQEACAQNAKDKSMLPHGSKKITIKNSIIIPASTDNKKVVYICSKGFSNPRSWKWIKETIILELKTRGKKY